MIATESTEFRVKPAPLSILCVDDEANILAALRRLLRPRGYQVLTSETAAGGLAILDETPVDLVLSDMRMPEMNGVQFLQEVRERSPETVRVLLTGYADLNSTIAAINEGGIHRYIGKPWDGEAVVSVVEDALERIVLRREKARLESLTLAQNEELKALNASLDEQVRVRTAELKEALDALQEAHELLKKGFFTSVKVFSNLIELREGAMAGHSRHVADRARRIAKRMKMTDAQVQDITLAGLLHGVGELGVPDAVLRKAPSTLSVEERDLVMKHPAKGQAALMALDQLAEAGKIIRSYRERHDGAGYPDRLSGESIPLGARILAVAHDYEAAQEGTLTGRWLSKRQARDYIVEGKGARYHPGVVDKFVAMLDGEGVIETPIRVVTPADLREGMVLADDLVSRDGLLLLSKGTVLRKASIEQLRRYDTRDEAQMTITVKAA